ncbi:hypothetical protein, partial [Nocardioides ferulae]|uniref:hypothetical protein n=1 Tax=Nocardioides ferulae TaxID=2340821 RepID=UPI0013DDD3BC
PEAHTQRRERARHERYVKLSQTDEHGFRHIIAKVTAGDAVWFDALVDRVADILALEHGHNPAATNPRPALTRPLSVGGAQRRRPKLTGQGTPSTR